MPLINVMLTPGAFDAAGRARLAQGFTAAALRAESIPDEPVPRSRALVLIQELAEGHFWSAGEPADQAVRGVFATLQVSGPGARNPPLKPRRRCGPGRSTDRVVPYHRP
jgi:phenylpyruvate tautomerase PptA (4-oxalocrotonate tautomerase family)